MTEALRWGILSTGNIARQFAEGLQGAQCSCAHAVASRHLSSAQQFAQTVHIRNAYGSYQELLDDREVEAVYLALPNAMHHEWTIKALNHGKHVLCEKPLARNVIESHEMFDLADRRGLLLVEAFMYRSHPLTQSVRAQIDRGAIGQLRMIRTSFCYCTKNIKNNIRFSTALAGGALMDVGCYCVNFSRYFAGAEPSGVHAVAHLHETGVDDIVAGTLAFDGALVASFTCGMSVHVDNTAYLCGSEGYIEVPMPWKPPVEAARFVLKQAIAPRQDGPGPRTMPSPQTFDVDAGKPLYALEADDFAATVRQGAAPRLTRQDTIGNMKVLDEMRRQIGLSVNHG